MLQEITSQDNGEAAANRRDAALAENDSALANNNALTTGVALTQSVTENGATENGAANKAPTDEKPRPNHKPATSSPTALQDMFLNGLRRENIDTVIYFCDGTQERGCVRAFDTFTILLENRNSGKLQLVYKHSIARIFPTRTPTQLTLPPRGGKNRERES